MWACLRNKITYIYKINFVDGSGKRYKADQNLDYQKEIIGKIRKKGIL